MTTDLCPLVLYPLSDVPILSIQQPIRYDCVLIVGSNIALLTTISRSFGCYSGNGYRLVYLLLDGKDFSRTSGHWIVCSHSWVVDWTPFGRLLCLLSASVKVCCVCCLDQPKFLLCLLSGSAKFCCVCCLDQPTFAVFAVWISQSLLCLLSGSADVLLESNIQL